MGNNQSRTPWQGTPAHYMSEHYGLETCRFLNKWHREIRFPEEGSFDMDQIMCVRATLLTQNSQSRQGEWRAFFRWSDEAAKRQSESQARSFMDTRENLEAQLANMAAHLAKSKDAQEKLGAQLAQSKSAQEKLGAQLAQSKSAQEKLGAQLDQSKSAQEKLGAQLDQSKSAQEKLAAQLAESKSAQEKLAAQLAESKSAQEKLEAQIAGFCHCLTNSMSAQINLEDQLDDSKNAQWKLAAQLAQSKDAKRKLGAQLAQSKSAQEKLRAQFAQSRSAQEKLGAQLAQSKDAQEKLGAQLAQSKDAQEKLEAQLEQSKGAQKELQAQLDDLKAKCQATPRPETSGPGAPSPQTRQPPAALWQQLLAGENIPGLASAPRIRSELLGLKKDFPDIQAHPKEFQERLDSIFRCYNLEWVDMNWFLGKVVPQHSVRERLLGKAQWPVADPGSGVVLLLAKQCLLGAILGVCPKNTDWPKICDCKQRQDETPAVFWRRLRPLFEQYSGIPQPIETAPDVVAYAFVQGLHPETLKRLQKSSLNWQSILLHQLVETADFYDSLRKQEQGSEDPSSSESPAPKHGGGTAKVQEGA